MEPLDLFKELSQLPTYTSVTFFPDIDGTPSSVHVGLIQKLHHREAKISLSQTLPFPFTDAQAAAHLQEIPKGNIEFYAPSRELKGMLVARDEERFIEVWDLKRNVLKFGSKVTKEVGEFIADEQWGQPQFSPRSDKILFTAHPPPPSPSDTPKFALDKYAWTPTWGELQKTLTTTQIFIIDFSTPSSAGVYPLLSEDARARASFGQGQFAWDGQREVVVATGFDPMEDERKLGVVYCTNRRSTLWVVRLDDSKKRWRLTTEDRSARSPRVVPNTDEKYADGPDSLVWLSNPLGGPHNSCATLHHAILRPETIEYPNILVAAVWDPAQKEEKYARMFPGLYLNSLPQSPFLARPKSVSSRLLLTSTCRSRLTTYLIDLPPPGQDIGVFDKIIPHQIFRESASYSVLGTDGKQTMAVLRSNLTTTPALLFATLEGTHSADAKFVGLNLKRTLFNKISSQASAALASLEVNDERLPTASHVETLHLRLANTSASPSRKLLLNPHGGPHSTTTDTFSPSLAALAVAGFEVVSVNYSGSLGFGNKHVQALVGQCGVLDVKDCGDIVEAWTKARSEEGSDYKVYIQGGSHGGFLTAHLTSKYPDAFSAAILRNPVTSLGENLCVTDIPDWVFNELGLPYSLSSADRRPIITPTPEQYAFLHSRSPIANVEKVTAHTLILMGLEDRRVPPAQSKAWYHSLKSKSAWQAKNGGPALDVNMLAFEGEGHAIDGCVAELAAFEASLGWLQKY